eukprot:m.313167 g.313167  ORF g.313167 m.313167 type:complete len:66 (-) comp16487_c0_seq9:600-797(-)
MCLKKLCPIPKFSEAPSISPGMSANLADVVLSKCTAPVYNVALQGELSFNMKCVIPILGRTVVKA